MRSNTLFGTLFPNGQARRITDQAVVVCVCRHVASCKLLQAALKIFSSGRKGLTNFTSVQNTNWNYSSVYFNIHVVRIQDSGTSVHFVTICNPAVDCIPSFYSYYVIACPMKRIPEAGGCQLSVSCHCLPYVDKDHAFGVSQKSFIPKLLSKTRSNCTRMKHILLAWSGARSAVLMNKELRCIARMGKVTHWKARRLHFPLNICNVIKSWGVRRKQHIARLNEMENACIHLVCCQYQGRHVRSLRTVLQLLIKHNFDHVHLDDCIALRDFFSSAVYHHPFLKYMWYIDVRLGHWSKRCHTVRLPTGEDYQPYNYVFCRRSSDDSTR